MRQGIPSGARPAMTQFGQPVSDRRMQHNVDARPAPASAPFKREGNMCTANGDTCGGRRSLDSPYCYGHLKSYGLVKKKVDADGSDKTDSSTDS